MPPTLSVSFASAYRSFFSVPQTVCGVASSSPSNGWISVRQFRRESVLGRSWSDPGFTLGPAQPPISPWSGLGRRPGRQRTLPVTSRPFDSDTTRRFGEVSEHGMFSILFSATATVRAPTNSVASEQVSCRAGGTRTHDLLTPSRFWAMLLRVSECREARFYEVLGSVPSCAVRPVSRSMQAFRRHDHMPTEQISKWANTPTDSRPCRLRRNVPYRSDPPHSAAEHLTDPSARPTTRH